MHTLQGRVAVVTGAASGIGLALARRFARAGMKLVLADIEAAPLARAVADLRSDGAVAIGMPVDVMSDAQVQALADAAYREFGGVHVLCNNAGVAAPALRVPAWETKLADWQWIMGINLMGVVHGVRAFVNTAWVAGLASASGPYFASKHGVTCLTEGLYKDLKSMGARLSASVLCPGLIRTGILDAERNRPADLGPPTNVSALSETSQRWASDFRAALQAGCDPAIVADAVADGILGDRFYVVPAQPDLIELIRVRMTDIVEQRNPSLPVPK